MTIHRRPDLRNNWRRVIRHLLCALFVALSGSLLGCSAWKEIATDSFELPATQISPDSVSLQITFLRVPVDTHQVNDELWKQVDEQFIPIEERLHLNQNGIRAGIVGNQLPELLNELLEAEQTDPLDGLDRALTSEMDVLAKNRLVNVREGRRTEIVSSSPRDELVMLYRTKDSKVRGKPFPEAQCILAVKPYPDGDGSVRLQVIPEVHHGEPRKQWVSGRGTFQLLAGREREVYQELMAQVQLSPGQSLLMTCTPESTGVGNAFFVESGRGDAQQKLLLVRLVQTQRDILFDVVDEPEGS